MKHTVALTLMTSRPNCTFQDRFCKVVLLAFFDHKRAKTQYPIFMGKTK